jgi:hypothetical protein
MDRAMSGVPTLEGSESMKHECEKCVPAPREDDEPMYCSICGCEREDVDENDVCPDCLEEDE